MSTAGALPDYAHLADHRFPGGTFELQEYEAWLWDDAVEATPEEDAVHPGAAYMIGLHGGRASITQIMEVLETAVDAGVMLGEIEFEFAGSLAPGGEFVVDGEILSVERKQGRRAGVFDRVRFQHRVRSTSAAAETPTATITHTWIIPRAEAES